MHVHPYRPASAARARLSAPPGRACTPPSIWLWPTPVPRLPRCPWHAPAARPTTLRLCVAYHPPTVNRHCLFLAPVPRGGIEHLSPDSTELRPLQASYHLPDFLPLLGAILERIERLAETQHIGVMWNRCKPCIELRLQSSHFHVFCIPFKQVFHYPEIQLVEGGWLPKSKDIA